MRHPLHASIAWKLTVANTLVSAVALSLAGAAFGVLDSTRFREMTLRNLSTQAQIAASNSVSALVFNDPAAAEVTLSGLRAAPNVVSAAISTPEGRTFATYRRDRDSQMPALSIIPAGQTEARHMDSQQITLARSIVFNGKEVGHVDIQSDRRELTARRNQSFVIGAVVLALSLLAAAILSWLLQRSISGPIVRLAAVANKVSEGRDYSVRATVTKQAHELAVLTDAFNDMLTQLQHQDTSLHEAADELEERVRQRTGELDTANKELEAFSYSVSHDLRAPLRHVTGFASLLEERARDQLDPQGLRYLRTITDAAKRMGQLIDDLLEFSRIGRSQLRTGRVSLNELFCEARQEVSADPNSANRVINWRVSDLPDVEADAATLRLAIINLLSNAVKYTSTRPAADIEVGTSQDHGDLVVFVRDNGVGFEMQYVHKLFGVFQRLHRTEEFEGTGIGLANVRRIIQRHGGRVWAESEIGCGATFYFSLPAKAQPV